MTDGCEHVCAEDCYHNPMGDPMLVWLTANNIDLDRVPMFPEIELLGSEMMIEYLYGYEGERQYPRFVFRSPATKMWRRPVLVPMTDELWEVYQRSRSNYLADRVLKALGEYGATVLAVKPGSQVVFVCAHAMPEGDDFIGSAIKTLEQALPGVGVTIMTGVDTVLHRAPQDDR